MKTTKNKNARQGFSVALLPLCVVFFANPTVRLVDIFPDFIACFIVVGALNYATYRSPFFAEAREGFIKLGVVSLLKIPAFVIENSVRAGNVSDFDITVLLTFTFSVVEGALFITAIRDLFAALFYLGERSEMCSLISPFPLSKKEKRKVRVMSPERLRSFAIFAVIFRLAACALPEFLLLTRTTDTGAYVVNIRVFYPYAVVSAVILSLAVSIIFAKRFIAYLRAMRSEGGFTEALDGLVCESARDELKRKIDLRRVGLTFNLLTLATVFTFVLRFDNLNGVNLVPVFAVGVILSVAVIRLVGFGRLGRATLIIGALYGVSALVAQITEINFLNTYTFEELARDERIAAEYMPTVIAHGVTVPLFCALVALVGISIVRYSRTTVLKSREGLEDDVYLKDRRRSLTRRVTLWVICGFAVVSCRFLDVYFNLFSDITVVSREDGIGGMDFGNVTYSLVPWFGTLVFALTAVYVGYTAYLVSRLKDDAEVYLS